MLLSTEVLLALFAGVVLSAPVWPLVSLRSKRWIRNRFDRVLLLEPARQLLLCGLLFLSITKIAASTYNPFIYFRF
jgi:hypothetical protein